MPADFTTRSTVQGRPGVIATPSYLATEAGIHILHQCGMLKALLPSINELPATVIEAYSSPPIGNTTLADRVALAPSVAVIGGTCANLWLEPVKVICAEIERSLAAAGGMRGVVLTSAGVMTPGCPIEKIAETRRFAKGLLPDRSGTACHM